MTSGLIDVWDAKTFDEDLIAVLRRQSDLIRNYMTTDHKIFLAYDLGRGPERPLLRPDNPYASDFVALKEAFGERMQSRTIRSWHYTRLTDQEVKALRRDGIHLSTPATLRARLDALVSSGALSAELADILHAQSPFHSDQRKSRSNKFWMVSHPVAINDGGVEPLLARWGGEVASMWVREPALLTPLAATGTPRVLEIATPMELTNASYWAGQAVIATFGRTLGCIPDKHAFDLYAAAPMKSDSILRIHSEDETSFGELGRSYPSGYVNSDIGRWKELTGEDD